MERKPAPCWCAAAWQARGLGHGRCGDFGGRRQHLGSKADEEGGGVHCGCATILARRAAFRSSALANAAGGREILHVTLQLRHGCRQCPWQLCQCAVCHYNCQLQEAHTNQWGANLRRPTPFIVRASVRSQSKSRDVWRVTHEKCTVLALHGADTPTHLLPSRRFDGGLSDARNEKNLPEASENVMFFHRH
jgi:hypothetical protein